MAAKDDSVDEQERQNNSIHGNDYNPKSDLDH